MTKASTLPTSNSHTAFLSPRLALEWTAVIKHVLDTSRPSLILAIGRFHPTITHSISAGNHNGGLSWISRSIWQTTTTLDLLQASDSGSTAVMQQSLTNAITGLVDLVQYLTLIAVECDMDDAATDKERVAVLRKVQREWLWTLPPVSPDGPEGGGGGGGGGESSNNNIVSALATTMSPLAALIGAYHVLSASVTGRTKHLQSACWILEKLVDPAAKVELRTSADSVLSRRKNTTATTTTSTPASPAAATAAATTTTGQQQQHQSSPSAVASNLLLQHQSLLATTNNTANVNMNNNNESSLSTARSLLARAIGGWNNAAVNERKDNNANTTNDDDDDDEDEEEGDCEDDDDEDDEEDEEDCDDNDNHIQENHHDDEMDAILESAEERIAAAIEIRQHVEMDQIKIDDEHDDDEDDDEHMDMEDQDDNDDAEDQDEDQDDDGEHGNVAEEDDAEIESSDEDEDAEHVCVDEDDEDTVIREDEVDEGMLELNEGDPMEMELDDLQASAEAANVLPGLRSTSSPLSPSLPDRKRAYIAACVQVLSVQHPHYQHHHTGSGHHHTGGAAPKRSPMGLPAENSLLESINAIVKPPKKPLNTKIIMRRAPTQEEFFRGSLSRNPISASMLKSSASSSSRSDAYDPTIADLRQHIANDLQMSDSAELIEILVANKILDMNLKLRVVHQVLWRTHLMENSYSTGLSSYLSGSAPSLFSSSGLSVIFSTGADGGGERVGGRNITADTPANSLPAMVATYRLAGLDGEATEDTVGVGDLADPEAPSDSASPEEIERLLEKEYGLTRLVTEGRGVFVMLRSVQHCITDTIRRIRRDDVGCTGRNPSRAKFKQDPPCPGLTLLSHCSKLSSNRKKLMQARAPTVLLTLLLEVLGTLEDPLSDERDTSTSNPTAEILQELIEVLTSDISNATDSSTLEEAAAAGYESDPADAASMPLLLESIETISLSSPLRNVIAKLLPFLTYGQADLSRQLAQHFNRHILVDTLSECESENQSLTKSSILMNTFVQTAISLPPNDVCNSLRIELINCGFIERVILFIAKDMPTQPPPWSTALWSKGEAVDSSQKRKGNAASKRKLLEDGWRAYFLRGGIRTAFKILTGLCKKHAKTQSRIAMWPEFLRSCHWLEATSDNTAAKVDSDGLGLLAETLVDEMQEENKEVSKVVAGVRQQTRLRKKELAQERRRKALVKMNSLGPLTEAASSDADPSRVQSVRGAAAYVLAPVLDLFRDSNPSNTASAAAAGTSTASRPKTGKASGKNPPEKPAWMAEMELMEDETGLTCAVCQEGRTLLPSELLGLYAHVKKVSIPTDQCGSKPSIDGTVLLKALPSTLPSALASNHAAKEWFIIGRSAGEDLPMPSSSSLSLGSSSNRRNSVYTTTVSAGNAIHFSCHRKARQADRNHPKAPKSEWEGANLRNNRINCNVILPLVSNRSSRVPLMAVDSALTDHQTSIANLVGCTPKSMLWTILHDVRFLMLRMAYGESLNTDCGGGSLASNVQLLLYQLLTADMFDKDAQVDQPVQSQHARCLSTGFLAACAIVSADSSQKSSSSLNQLTRGIADAAPMAVLTSVLFHNATDGVNASVNTNDESSKPHPKRQWLAGKDYFLRGLLICAGRRHALRLESSGCNTSRGPIARHRASSFAEWDLLDGSENPDAAGSSGGFSFARASSARGNNSSSSRRRGSSSKATIEDFQNAIRPMITLYAIVDHLSAEFSLTMEDIQIQESAERLVYAIEECQRSKSIHELLDKAKVTMDHEEMMEYLQKGMIVA
jgi:hypothetical protein